MQKYFTVYYYIDDVQHSYSIEADGFGVIEGILYFHKNINVEYKQVGAFNNWTFVKDGAA